MGHRWVSPILHYPKTMVVYPYPFLLVINRFLSCIIFINDCILPAVSKKCPSFSGFCRKLAHKKLEQCTYKSIKHNGSTVFLQALVLRGHKQEWCQLRLIIYHIFITLPQKFHQIPFSSPPPPPQPSEYTATFGLVGHVRQPRIADKGQSRSDASLLFPILYFNPLPLNFTSKPNKPVICVVRLQAVM